MFKLKYNPTCPIDIFNHEELNNNEKMVYIVIHNIIGENKKCTLLNEDIATASNTSLATVKRAISKLQDLDLIWLDVDRKRTVKDPNEAVRHIYTNYKYYTDRNKKDKAIHMPKKFNSIHHFRNWCKSYAQGFRCTITKADGQTTVDIRINEKGHIENCVLNKEYHPTNDKEFIYYVWESLYKNLEIVTNHIKERNSKLKEQK